jgi:indolepyruvate ferredoxin oxidoreductase
MAAHLDRLAVAELDFTALAQKGGSVMCHLRIANGGTPINQPRVDWGEADAVIMGDLIVGCLPDSIGTIRNGATRVLANTHLGSTAEFTRNPDFDPRKSELLQKVRFACGDDRVTSFDVHGMVQEQFGDTTGANMFLIGHAWQQGLIPVSEAALMQAIALNGVTIEANKRAFAFGQVVAAGGSLASKPQAPVSMRPEDWPALVERRAVDLVGYQNVAYAAKYRAFVERCAMAEQKVVSGDLLLTKTVANNLFKLMAYKDEYEVARLYRSPEFVAALKQQFEGDFTLRFHLAPPSLAKPKAGGVPPRKLAFGSWMMSFFALLTRLKILRGTALDPFGYTEERRMERRLVDDYRMLVEHLLARLSPATLGPAVRLAALPEKIRGYGHVKTASVEMVKREEQLLLQQFDAIVAPLSSARKGVA